MLARLAVALLLALAAHSIALWIIAQQIAAMGSVIKPQTDPLFTRQITQQGATELPGASPAPAATAVLQPKRRAAQSNIAGAATKSVAIETPTQDITAQQSTPSPTPTELLAPATPTDAALPESTPTAALSPSATATVTAPTSTAAAQSAALALQGEWPGDTRLSYQLGGYYRGELFGDAQVQWTRPTETATASMTGADAASSGAVVPSDRYQVRIDINVGGLARVQMLSQGRVRAAGLQPEAYEEVLPSSRRNVRLTTNEVLLMDGRRLPRPPEDMDGVQDTASQFVELGHRFSTGRARLAKGEVVRVWLARPGGLDEWVYDIGAAETLYLPLLGAVQAYHLKPRPLARARGTIVAEMWVAPSLQNLPVRIKITLDAQSYLDLTVKKIEQR